jgi:hypothetical protein
MTRRLLHDPASKAVSSDTNVRWTALISVSSVPCDDRVARRPDLPVELARWGFVNVQSVVVPDAPRTVSPILGESGSLNLPSFLSCSLTTKGRLARKLPKRSPP